MRGTIHMALRNAAHALLAADPQLADGGVIRGRRGRPMAEQFKRQVHVYLDTAMVERAQYGGQPDDWMTRLRIECCARSTDADLDAGVPAYSGEENADQLAVDCYARLQADASLGGLLMDLKALGLQWDTEEGDTQIGVTQLAFDAQHRTEFNAIAA